MGRKVGDGVAPPPSFYDFFENLPYKNRCPPMSPWDPQLKNRPLALSLKNRKLPLILVFLSLEKDDRNSTRTWFSHLEHSKFCQKSESLLENITWLTDFANKLHEVKKLLTSFYTICYSKLSCFIKKFCKITFWIKFNLTTCINMWLSSLNIFEENQFYEIKKKNIFNQKHFKLS